MALMRQKSRMEPGAKPQDVDCVAARIRARLRAIKYSDTGGGAVAPFHQRQIILKRVGGAVAIYPAESQAARLAGQPFLALRHEKFLI